MLLRPIGMKIERAAGAGDLLASGESFAALAADANSTLTGAMIASGVINRTGMTAGRTDTTDTADNVLNALSGNEVDRDVLTGCTFRFIYRQAAAFATTWAHGRGWIAGVGTLNVTASLVREYIVEILCAAREVTRNCGTTNASTAVTLDEPQPAGTIVPGMLITGAGVTAGTRVAGVTYGRTSDRSNTDKICAITMDANATATVASGVALIFSPVLRINSIGERTL